MPLSLNLKKKRGKTHSEHEKHSPFLRSKAAAGVFDVVVVVDSEGEPRAKQECNAKAGALLRPLPLPDGKHFLCDSAQLLHQVALKKICHSASLQSIISHQCSHELIFTHSNHPPPPVPFSSSSSAHPQPDPSLSRPAFRSS